MYSDDVLEGVGKEAAFFVFENFRSLLKMAVILAAVEASVWWLLPVAAISEILQSLTGTIFYAVFAIAIHRWIILGELNFPPAIDLRILYFVGVMIVEGLALGAVILGGVGPGLLIGVLIGSGALVVILMIVLVPVFLVCGVWLISRLITVYPHIAVSSLNSFQLSSGWELSKEPVWQIAKRVLLFLVCTGVPILLIVSIMPETVGENAATIGERTIWAPFTFLVLLVGYAPIPFFVALASFVYRRLFDDLKAQIAT
ncbi:MAG: hypothetical protein GXP06_09625 [Alphaproteobacteria bacterium]|nr:hypothetical protein [Alphaproteobacteria bacterium]